ncbi:MAG TPA: O-antigen ligase family protein [Steroidobacteraceae bacterium]|nr:O-antigen ligase family protein [Steroidobacteraceae bacterium]
MNEPLPAFLVFLALLLVLAWRAPKYLFAIWPVTLLVFPSMRTLFGGAPFYWYDAVSLLILARLYLGRELAQWPAGVPRWHWWFIGSALMLGTLVPIVRYGFGPEMLWILAHASMAWMAYAIGVALYVAPQGVTYRQLLTIGVFVALVITAAIAALEFGNESLARAFNTFFFHDMQGQFVMLEDVGATVSSARVNGPHADPNTFGGTSAIVCAVALLLIGQQSRKLAWLALALAGVAVAATVSRQVLVAAVVGGLVVAALGTGRARARVVGAAAVLVVVVVASGVAGHWAQRLSKWQGGVQQDMNIVGRLVIGPQRMFTLISQDPSVLVVGAGLDMQKLAKKSADSQERIGIYRYGFASNSFLLPLYYMGIVGFVINLAFWLWTLRKALQLPRDSRALDVACVVTAMALVASDNYASVVKVTVAVLFLLAAIVAGRWSTQASPAAEPAVASPKPRFANVLP